MVYIRIDGREVMGLTAGERRELHPHWLGRNPTWDDVRKMLEGKTIRELTHHDHRIVCDGCTSRVFTWAEEYSKEPRFTSGVQFVLTGRRFCRACVKNRGEAGIRK